MRGMIVAALWAVLTVAASAQDCVVVSWAMESVEDGVLYEVNDDVDRAHFYKSDSEDAGCPFQRDCRRRGFVVGGDSVMVVASDERFACALYVGGPPKYAMTAGWIETALLSERRPRDYDAEDFLGRWGYGEFHEIEITDATDGMVHISGEALFGAEDPERLARGAVNLGSLDSFVPEDDSEIAFTIDWDGMVQEYAYGEPGDNLCRVRMHRDGPYLVVQDNHRCGGMNVTFTGLYRRGN